MRVLVTGASGMFGKAVATALINRGDDVTVFQRSRSGLGCREILGDITNPDDVARSVDGIDAIVHMAARVSPIGSPRAFEDVNVGGSANIVAAASRAGVTRLVNVSSPSVAHVGAPQVGAGASPAEPLLARSRYARSKAKAEILMLEADRPGLAVVSVRPHLVWGPGGTQLVERIVQRARAGRMRLVGSGAALVDTIYVDNAANAIMAAIDRAEQAHGRALVISNGEPRPVAELLRSICLAAGVEPPTRHLPLGVTKALGGGAELLWNGLGLRRDPPMTRFLAEQLGTAHWFDQRATRQLLQWEPSISLAEGLERLATHAQQRRPEEVGLSVDSVRSTGGATQ
ncbi:MAG: NAD-dependent epimerase/dehydratase family protein [Actinobacteria bacterium]|nr:NAD-dependent epimerase/dehydratase family protein [Actinomycetota bacterium]